MKRWTTPRVAACSSQHNREQCSWQGCSETPVQYDGLNHDPGCTIAPMPQSCILLRNMFDPKTETDPNFDDEIKEDVTEECSKFGRVKHIAVAKNSPGFVFVRFDSQAG